MKEATRRRETRADIGEVDLFELAEGLWREKWVVVAVILAVTLCALVYSVLLPPVYEASAQTLPPRSVDVAPLNLGRAQAGLDEVSTEEVYDLFTRNLTSETTRRAFFAKYYKPYLIEQGSTVSRDELLRRMREDITVHLPDVRDDSNIIAVSVHADDPEVAAEWNNLFIQIASNAAFEDLQANTLLEINNRKTVLESRIDVLREFAATQREDRIVRLNDALNVAEAVGVDAPLVTRGRTAAEDELSQMIDGNLAYMRGSKAIRAELELLRARENEDPYIDELRSLQQQVNLLGLVNAAPDGVALFTLDRAADVPDGPIKPRKQMIVIMGFLLGSVLALGIALLRVAVRNHSRSAVSKVQENG